MFYNVRRYRSDKGSILIVLYIIFAAHRWDHSIHLAQERALLGNDRIPDGHVEIQTKITGLSNRMWENVFGRNNRDHDYPIPDKGHVQNQTNNASTSNAVVVPVKNESIGSCIHQPNQPLSKIDFKVDEDSQRRGNETKIIMAICEFHANKQVHFPHAMQQLYRCYSLWMDYPEAKAILIAPNEQIEWQLYRKPFTKGLLPVFNDQMNMSTYVRGAIPAESMNELKTSEKYIFKEFNSEPNYRIKHVNALHAIPERQLGLDDNSAQSCKEKKPRIGILNRNSHSGRSILNADYIASLQEVQELSRNNTVEVKYLDGLQFEEQVAFFRSIDILLSPHGAQLTGVAFMNAQCGHVVELFTKGYKLSEYFGSLALESHKDYSYIYMSANSSNYEHAKDRRSRIAARQANLCPSTTMMVDTMRKLVEEWQQCCDSKR